MRSTSCEMRFWMPLFIYDSYMTQAQCSAGDFAEYFIHERLEHRRLQKSSPKSPYYSSYPRKVLAQFFAISSSSGKWKTHREWKCSLSWSSFRSPILGLPSLPHASRKIHNLSWRLIWCCSFFVAPLYYTVIGLEAFQPPSKQSPWLIHSPFPHTKKKKIFFNHFTSKRIPKCKALYTNNPLA